MRTSLTILSVCFSITACRTPSEPPAPAYPPTPNANNPTSAEAPVSRELPVESLAVLAQEPAPVAPPTIPAVLPVRVVAGENTPLVGPKPALRVTTPTPFQRITRGSVFIRASIRNFSLAADPGNHVHLVFDNDPYIAIRDLSRPINLDALLREHLGHEIGAGSHLVRMFASRANHESVKTQGAFVAVPFSFGSSTPGFSFDVHQPLLTYSRPIGCNLLSSRVLLDFYLTNVPALSENGYRVRYVIDNELTGDLTEWVPYYIENLTAGEHTIRLSLIDANGESVGSGFNEVTRSITVATACPEETPMVHEMPAEHADPIEMRMQDRAPLLGEDPVIEGED